VAEGSGALFARTERAKILVAEDAAGVAIAEMDLDGVVANWGGRLRTGFGLVQGEERGGGERERRSGILFGALVIAGGTGTIVAQEGKIEVAGVAVAPNDVDTGAGFHVDLDGGRDFALIDGCWHVLRSSASLTSVMLREQIEKRGEWKSLGSQS